MSRQDAVIAQPDRMLSPARQDVAVGTWPTGAWHPRDAPGRVTIMKRAPLLLTLLFVAACAQSPNAAPAVDAAAVTPAGIVGGPCRKGSPEPKITTMRSAPRRGAAASPRTSQPLTPKDPHPR
jgi:hypothetical protein